MPLIALLPSQCRDSGDIKFIRSRCNFRFYFVSVDYVIQDKTKYLVLDAPLLWQPVQTL